MIHHGLLLGDDGKKLSKRATHASVGDLRDEGIPAAAVRAYLDELGLPRHDVHLDVPRIHRLAIDAIAAMSDDELATAAGAPLDLARALRGARTLVEAREITQQILEPAAVSLGDEARSTIERFVELREGGAERLDEADARAIVRELKAVGGNLKLLRLALTGAERGPELWTVVAAVPRGRSAAACRRRYNTAMTVRLYDTATKALVELPPAPAQVGMYVCGPTVYQRAHIGNAVPFVIFAWLRNWLRERGYDVTYVHNITDVNDKIYEVAPGASAERARAATQWYLEDTASFGLEMPDEQPLATETIPEIVALIEELVDSGHAYASGGDVYFRVSSFETYGALSGQKPDQVEEQEPSALKEDPRDFALWKATKEGEDTSWESPWGLGRPGWHIECSAMAEKSLGPEFLIHGGGLDLVFPHHENERAQSLAVGRPFAKIWMHNGLLRFVGAKMSKSAGPVATIQDVIAEWGREAALLFLMTGHWRKPLEFSPEAMTAASVQVESLRNALRGEVRATGDWEAFAAVLDDDFNTPAALAILHRWARDGALVELRRGLAIFGLGALGDAVDAPADVKSLAQARVDARAARDFAEADRLRDEIARAGWEVRDVPDGFELVPAS